MKKIVFTILVLFLTGCITQEYTVKSHVADYSLLINKGCEVFLNEPKVNYTIVQEIFVTAYPGVVYMEKRDESLYQRLERCRLQRRAECCIQ